MEVFELFNLKKGEFLIKQPTNMQFLLASHFPRWMSLKPQTKNALQKK